MASLSVESFAQLSRDIEYYKGKIIHMDKKANTITVQRADGAKRIFDISAARHPDLAGNELVIVIVPLGTDKAINVKISIRQ